METYKNYFDVLTTRSEEEERLYKLIDEENKKFEATPEAKEHHEKVMELLHQISEEYSKRMDRAKSMKPIRKRAGNSVKPIRAKEQDSEELTEAVKAVEKLSYSDKKVLWARCFAEHIPVDEEKKVDDETMDEFHEILVQTAIDFINEKGLKDVWSVSFYADSLQESAKFGQWCPATDSSLTLEAMNHDKAPYRTEIGHSF